MRIIIDQQQCDSSGICVKERPEIFRFQEGSKKAAPLVNPVPPGLEDECRRVAEMCPTKAISLVE